MATLDEHNRLSTAFGAVPKAWLAFGLAGALWALLVLLGVESLQMLRMLGA